MLKKAPIFCLIVLMVINMFGSKVDDDLKLVLYIALLAVSLSSVLLDMRNTQDPNVKKQKYLYLGLCFLIPTLMTVYFFYV
ncbi:hypothetical protein [Flavobacterium sp. BFFFF1]|uniref:hypothetical protein n=1 Tax=Flavobacterium sp. BFFFF1 TaxID=2015557 RepID=UPI0025BC0961|nr:hypothetical protein [Flavobacterium sp. BFFFF1]